MYQKWLVLTLFFSFTCLLSRGKGTKRSWRRTTSVLRGLSAGKKPFYHWKLCIYFREEKKAPCRSPSSDPKELDSDWSSINCITTTLASSATDLSTIQDSRVAMHSCRSRSLMQFNGLCWLKSARVLHVRNFSTWTILPSFDYVV